MNLHKVFFRISILALILIIPVRVFSQDYPRAMWVWEDDTRTAISNASAAQQLLDFSAANNIGTLYLYADSYQGINDVTQNPGRYQSFISSAHDQGINVQALLGSAYLHTDNYFLPEKRADALAMVSNVLNYNSSSSITQRFDGFNVDIEPYTYAANTPDSWDNHRPTYSGYYLDMLSQQKQLITASGQSMTFGPDIPRWYDTISPPLNVNWNGETQPLFQHILDLSDYVAIMDYKNNAYDIFHDAQGELTYADQIGKEVVVGVETGPAELASLTFLGFSYEQMEAILATAENNLDDYASYEGYAIHDYNNYQNIAPVPEPSSIALLLLGGAGYIGFFLRKKLY